MALKMRVLYLSNKGKLRSIAEQLSKENDIKVDTIPPAYNVEKEYAMIITNSGGAPVITADEGLNITDDVLARLNEEYVQTKNAKN